MNNKGLLFAIAAAAGIYFLTKGSGSVPGGSTQVTPDQMRSALINWISKSTTDTDYSIRLAIEAFNEMTDSELTAAYQWVFYRKQIQPDLLNLSVKYNLFT